MLDMYGLFPSETLFLEMRYMLLLNTIILPLGMNSGSCCRNHGPIRHHLIFFVSGSTTRIRLYSLSDKARSPVLNIGKSLAISWISLFEKVYFYIFVMHIELVSVRELPINLNQKDIGIHSNLTALQAQPGCPVARC